jgi:hypothetical protein
VILNCIPKIIVAILHAQDFLFFQETNENGFGSCGRFTKQAGLSAYEPTPVCVHLFPLVVSRIEQNRVRRLDVFGEGMGSPKPVGPSTQIDVEKHFSQVRFH